MRIKALALTVLAGLSTPVWAQDSTQVLRQALATMPAVVGTNPEPMQAFFFDVQAWRAASRDDVSAYTLRRLVFAYSIEPLGRLSPDLIDGWAEKGGVAFNDIAYFAGFGQPPQTVSYWGLRDEAAAGRLFEGLKERDFIEVPGPVAGVLGNGKPTHRMDPRKSDATNPWRGPIGRVYFVTQLGHALVQAPAPEAMAVLSKIKPSLAESAVVSASLDGLSGTVGVDEGHIVQAAVISPRFGAPATDPAKFLGKSPAEAKRAFENEMREGSGGIPLYLGGVIADVQLGERPGMVVSLTYPDCALADAAVEGIKARWTETMTGAVEAELSGQSVATSGQLCAAVVSFTGTATAQLVNPVLSHVMDRYLKRTFDVLQIGAK